MWRAQSRMVVGLAMMFICDMSGSVGGNSFTACAIDVGGPISTVHRRVALRQMSSSSHIGEKRRGSLPCFIRHSAAPFRRPTISDATFRVGSRQSDEFRQIHHTGRGIGGFSTPIFPLMRSRISTERNLINSRYDNLVAGVAEISIGTSLGTLWSELTVAATGCGPLNLSDGLERLCYQGVIVFAGYVIFARIVSGMGQVELCRDYFGRGALAPTTLWQVRIAEWMALSAVAGAVIALLLQMGSGGQMDGLTGIDVEMCRALRDL